MPCFASFIEIPELPEKPPNFCILSELDTHRTFRIKAETSESTKVPSEGSSDGNEQQQQLHLDEIIYPVVSNNSQSTSPNNPKDFSEDLLKLADEPITNEKDNLFENITGPQVDTKLFSCLNYTEEFDERQHLLIETEMLKAEVDRLQHERDDVRESLVGRVHTLEEHLKQTVQLKNTQEEQNKELLEKLRKNTRELEAANDKFTKLKDFYQVLRDKYLQHLKVEEESQRTIHELNEINDQLQSKLQNKMSTPMLESEESTTSELVELRTTVPKLMSDMELMEKSLTDFKTKIRNLTEENVSLTESLHFMELRVSETQTSLEVSEDRCEGLELRMKELPKTVLSNFGDQLLTMACSAAIDQIQQTLTRMDDDELIIEFRSSTEMLLFHTESTRDYLGKLGNAISSNNPDSAALALVIQSLAFHLSETLMHNISTVGTQANLTRCKDPLELVQDTTSLLELIRTHSADSSSLIESLLAKLLTLSQSVTDLHRLRHVDNQEDADQWESMLRSEMDQTTSTIQAAEQKIQELSKCSPSSAFGSQPQVNQRILNHCSGLIAAIGQLISTANEIQKSFKIEPKRAQSYKRQNRWTQGLVSAAKSVGACANLLVETADQVLTSHDNSLERLIVIAQEVSASSIQVFAASCGKLDMNSPLRNELHSVRKNVSHCTSELVASVKSAIEIRGNEELDFSRLTLTQAKRMEMEVQVRVLSLEAQLNQEHIRLAQLRKNNYHNAGEIEYLPSATTSVM